MSRYCWYTGHPMHLTKPPLTCWAVYTQLPAFIFHSCLVRTHHWSSQLHTELKSSFKIKASINFRLERDSYLWPLRYRCSSLLIELSSHLGAGHVVSWLRWRYKWIYKISYTELWRKIIDSTAAHKLRWSILSSFLSSQFKCMIFHIFTCIFTIMKLCAN